MAARSSMHKRVNCIQTQYLAAEQFLQELVVAGLKQAKVRIHAIRELCHACSTHPPQLCWKPRRGCGALGTGPSTRHTQEKKRCSICAYSLTRSPSISLRVEPLFAPFACKRGQHSGGNA